MGMGMERGRGFRLESSFGERQSERVRRREGDRESALLSGPQAGRG